MNIANKKLLCAFLGVTFIYVVHSYRIRTPKSCNIPNGSRGVCTSLSQCQPLQDIKNTKDRTSPEYAFYIQCRSLCTDNMVCCPPESDWDKVKYIPIDYTRNPNETTITSSNRFLLNVDTSQVTKCGIQAPSTQKIIGGDVVGIDEYPWLVLLDYMDDNKGLCGGSLITNKFVVTAAHCLETQYGKPIQVRLGEYNTSSYPTDTVVGLNGVPESTNVTLIDVEWAEKYPDYEPYPKLNNDIALIKMSESVQFSEFIRPICLPEVNFVDKVPLNTIVITAGWGETEAHEISDVKKQVAIPYKPLDDCKTFTPRLLYREKHICAGGAGKDSCNGDSGGPLMYKNGTTYVMVGIVSSGRYNCGFGFPALYTNVFNYVDWIKGLIDEDTP